MADEHRGVFDPKKSREQEYRETTQGRAVRPRDASTLIIVRRDGSAPRVLMGQRHADHKFMPNKFVFPGGRVDPADSRIAPAEDLRAPVARRLMARMRGTPTERRARALALAAIRETFEETGLVIGQPVAAPARSKHPDWNEYFAQGVAPALGSLDFVARAITPPYRTRRFDTRFFIADTEAIQGDPLKVAGSGELQGLHWLTLADARDLDLPNITRVVLDEIDERLRLATAAQNARATPFIYFRGGNAIRDTIGD
ncbi:NUDIX hydrolase [Parvibaculum sp.]|uniref:NUDIX hydrolase n=1 Tax=Parvibaculum sp. TaxID=2024848 RepID=UPI001DEB46AF|nr:NUDIX hydrolase [Parvibaculum sp.]MBX3488173.1 NUDIX hydrolase [Parvibaculum sp.]MCW5727849.1 NUDIX hydrolase [Parvibaculum sp.]